jgi:hypothetical protein
MKEINNPLQDPQIAKRIAMHSAVSNKLASLSDQRITLLIDNAKPIGKTIGGTASILTLDNMNIFIKKIRLTDIERRPENMMSTANIFDLPLYYQYGLDSAGFGVWRELAVHTMSTQWVETGECVNFPMMYHWRLLNKSLLEPTTVELKELKCDVEFWAGSSAVRERLLANMDATAEIVLFLEYIPENLHQWLSKQILQGDKAANLACEMVEDNLKSIISFMNSHGLLHFDAHFFNILTDGHRLYFADFGLAINNQFELSKAELNFFNRHHNYDQCYSMAYFVEWLLANLFGIENWVIGNHNPVLLEYATGKGRPLSPSIHKIVMRYLPVAVVMNRFFVELKKSKEISYPSKELDRAWCLSVG